MKRYNHTYDFAVEVVSNSLDAEDVTGAMLRVALLKRINSLSDAELEEACGCFDSFEESLLPWIVLYTDDTFNVPEGAIFMACSSENAEEQMLSENPSAHIVWLVQTDDINKAFEVYHEESAMEDTE